MKNIELELKEETLDIRMSIDDSFLISEGKVFSVIGDHIIDNLKIPVQLPSYGLWLIMETEIKKYI
jgi:hypothetical protein